jgi:riboflavin kinase/FMN adenylyltransferase
MQVSTFPRVEIPAGARPVVTLGNFDGVHLGHQRLIRGAVELAAAAGVPSVVVTFEPHPMSVLRPGAAPKRILTLEQKAELIASLGVDFLVVIPFTLELSRKEPAEFVHQVLVEKLAAGEIILGTNFRFGRGRAGDLATLRELGRKEGFQVREIPSALHQGKLISSSVIRAALAESRLEEVTAMLGRPYFVDGRVVKGDGRGARIGFPTANLEWSGDLLLSDGVYVSSARLGESHYPGMSHIGRRPTFSVETRALETHLFDFSAEIYGRQLRLFFHRRLRETIAFRSPEALARQLALDQEQARAFFGAAGPVVL